MEALFFNADAGFLEGVVRGYKAGLLTQANYNNLTQCDTLEDFRMQLSATEYGNFLANEPLPISTTTISERATQILVDQFNYLRNNSVHPLDKFLEYMTYAYMIDNVVLIITGTLHERDTHELLERCHPLGVFDTLPALCVATNVEELYHSVLVETPLAPYFRDALSANDLDDLNIEIIRNTLYRAYLEDFSNFCASIGGPTAESMQAILAFEADRRTINITLNSFGTELLFPTIGRLYPGGNNALARADDLDAVRQACDGVPEYRAFFDTSASRTVSAADDTRSFEEDDPESALAASLERKFFEHEVHLNKTTFLQQFNYAVFYSYMKLKEQEIRSIAWIAECLAMRRKERIGEFVALW
ncbi:putative vacuolar atp synthase subunit D [Cantharellus anzutake]|uniref:putative vacuolar atp synthase subunit D n=1 Tax=Cantharellus anzutake TaxID=1750568 RepID=UPI001906F8E9|nr:putative vacuolar atp synthase subunit D [Cantharellus anzutake]KAF8333537.1 putative vacuolar atp synthase subunit D [Cantharellus anzutake]